LDVNLEFMTANPAPLNLSLYQQVPTTTFFPTTTNVGQVAAVAQAAQAAQAQQVAVAQAQQVQAAQVAQAQQVAVAQAQAQQVAAAQAQAAAAAQAAAQQQAVQQAVVAAEAASAMAATTAAPTTAMPMMAAFVPAPAPATMAPPIDPAAPDGIDAGISMPDASAADMLPMTAEADPESAERLMRAARDNARPTGPEVKVIADWAERFGKYSVDATVKAMRNVVSQIAREKAEEVIANVFNAKYPNLHVHGVLPPAPAAAPASAAPGATALAPGEKVVG
jgi:multidrug efflux pump subunit AcrA (membrane-fusion protein)